MIIRRRNHIEELDPWLHAACTLGMFGFACFYFGQGHLWGLWLLIPTALFGWLTVWGIKWRWKSDIEWRDSRNGK